MLWVRCAAREEALKATDLLLRDRNFPLVVLDLKLNPIKQLRKIPTSTWFVSPGLFEAQRLKISAEPFLMIEGMAQNRHHTIHIKAHKIERLDFGSLQPPKAHDFA